MSLRFSIYIIGLLSIISCKDSEDKKEADDLLLRNIINVEKLDYSKHDLDDEDEAVGKAYADFSYNYLQTTYYKRHLNSIGLLIDPYNNEYIRRYSYSYKKAGEHYEGMRLLQLAIDQETEKGELMSHLGYAAWNYLYFLRDYKRAINSADQNIELYNGDLDANCHGEPCSLIKGVALYRQRKYENAIEAFSAYQDFQEQNGFSEMDNFLLVFYKARCLMELGRFDKAINYFSYYTIKNPQAECSYQLANIYLQQNQLRKAKKEIELAQDALNNGFVFLEPYFERFDKVFQYQIDDLNAKIYK